MDKGQLINLIETKNPTTAQILGWVRALPGTSSQRNPSISRVGDVHMHPIFLHPYVLLEKKGDVWICALLTSEETCTEALEPTRSRFFTGRFFTTALLTYHEPQGTFINVYENRPHLNSVYKKLKELFK
jgi:hypothetical protein